MDVVKIKSLLNEVLVLLGEVKASNTDVKVGTDTPKKELVTKTGKKYIITPVTDICPLCGSGCWDNSTNKKFDSSPDVKCKNKDCGTGAWKNVDGNLAWQVKDKPVNAYVEKKTENWTGLL